MQKAALGRRLDALCLLDELKLGFHLVEKVLFGFKLRACFFDELFWRLFDVARIIEAIIECVDLLAELKDAIFEVGFVLFENIRWNLEVDIVSWYGKAEASDFFGAELWYAWSLCEVLDKELVGVHERVVVEGDGVCVSAGEALVMTANISDDVLELFEFLDSFHIDLIWFWPRCGDDHAGSPAECLPDSLGDEWSEWMEHDEDLLESRL